MRHRAFDSIYSLGDPMKIGHVIAPSPRSGNFMVKASIHGWYQRLIGVGASLLLRIEQRGDSFASIPLSQTDLSNMLKPTWQTFLSSVFFGKTRPTLCASARSNSLCPSLLRIHPLLLSACSTEEPVTITRFSAPDAQSSAITGDLVLLFPLIHSDFFHKVRITYLQC
jgi:hypothetical protein